MIYAPHPLKRCSKCSLYKPHRDFSPRPIKKAPDGLNHQCKECNNKTTQSWRNNNPVALLKHRLRQREYRANHPDRILLSQRKYSDSHREEMRKRDRQRRLEHGEELRRRARIRRERDKIKRNEETRRWQREHPEIRRAARTRRKMKKRNLPATFSGQDWIAALEYWHGVCAYCGNGASLFDQYPTLQQEHHVPVAKGGGYVLGNILPACQSCNYSKKDRDPGEWIIWKFGKRKASVILKRIRNYFEWVKGQ